MKAEIILLSILFTATFVSTVHLGRDKHLRHHHDTKRMNDTAYRSIHAHRPFLHRVHHDPEKTAHHHFYHRIHHDPVISTTHRPFMHRVHHPEKTNIHHPFLRHLHHPTNPKSSADHHEKVDHKKIVHLHHKKPLESHAPHRTALKTHFEHMEKKSGREGQSGSHSPRRTQAHHNEYHELHRAENHRHAKTILKNVMKNQAHAPMEVCGNSKYCKCDHSMHTVNCNGEALHTTNIRPAGTDDVFVIHMQHNMITHLNRHKIVPGIEDQLHTLDFAFNELRLIGRDTFDQMFYLEKLVLSHNHINKIQIGAFNYITFLKDLRLDHNDLVDLSEPVFANLTNLEYLSLDFNPLKNLGPKTFTGLRHLRDLSLEFTHLSFIDESWFHHMPHLETLTLRGSKFHTMPVLRGLDRLHHLDISLNPIQSINHHNFYTMPHLTKIIINKMPHLRDIEECAFCGLRFLQYIEIRNNSELSRVHPLAFSKPNHFDSEYPMALIDLSNNALTTFPEFLLPWKNASSIKLSGNLLECDCRIDWLHKMLLDEIDSARFQDRTPRCHTPGRVSGHPLSLIHKNELSCQFSRISTGRVLIAITICILIGSSAIACWYLCMANTSIRTGKLPAMSFKTVPLPKYAYRNLAMRNEGEDMAHLTKHQDEPTAV